MSLISKISKIYFFTAFFLGISCYTYALEVGIQGGLTDTKQIYNQKKKHNQTWTIGAYAQQSLLFWGIQLEGIYVKKSLKNEAITSHNHYLYCPIFLKLFLPFKTSVDFGWNSGFLLAAYQNENSNYDQIVSIDYGPMIGLSKKITRQWGVSIHYYHALSHISKSNTSHQYRNWYLNIQYRLYKLL